MKAYLECAFNEKGLIYSAYSDVLFGKNANGTPLIEYDRAKTLVGGEKELRFSVLESM